MGSVFKFKQFEVNQAGCAMKINTDGVILGAVADMPGALRILDIGTGTGVIALMLAQRFTDAEIEAVEIDEAAARAAGNNFANSGFSARTKVYHRDIAAFESSYRYDMIVSNPPYFINDLKNAEQRKMIARHTDENFFELLLLKASELLNDAGLLWLILPVKQANFVTGIAAGYGLMLQKEISICSDIHKPVIRKIVCLGRTGGVPLKKEIFYIYERKGVYTQAYQVLLKDFFLAF